LKENGGLYRQYASATVACSGTAEAALEAKETDLLSDRFNINFGAAVGTYAIGEITIKKTD